MAHSNGPEIPHGTLAEYVKGLIWSIVLTAISFSVVMSGSFERTTSIIILFVVAVMQFVAQLVYFLHMKSDGKSTWNIISVIFTILNVLAIGVGTIWVMLHLHSNMQIGF